MAKHPPDPDNPGWVLGWAVYRLKPWALAGFYPSEEAAYDGVIGKKGFKVAYGSHRLGSDDFIGKSEPPPKSKKLPRKLPEDPVSRAVHIMREATGQTKDSDAPKGTGKPKRKS
jgi:hypothetical protein